MQAHDEHVIVTLSSTQVWLSVVSGTEVPEPAEMN